MKLDGNRQRPAGTGATGAEFDRLRTLVTRSPVLKYLVAAIWALVVGLLMAGGAALLGRSAGEVLQIGVLGGVGAAVYILFFARSA